MSKLRPIIFWLHLAAGVVAGMVIAIMSFTGVALAFEKEIIAWAERDARRVTPPADAQRLSLDALLAKVREQHPEARPSGITVSADPREAVLFSLGRTNAIYANPYTGEIRPPGAARTRAFMHAMIDWHRYLGAHGDRRPAGKAITGACNAAFLVLALTGLYLWWPRNWTKKAVRAVAVVSLSLHGKARDFNWHNAIGFWCAPVLIVLTVTAMPISYRWAGDLIYKLTGTEPPPAGASPAQGGPPVEAPKPPPGARPLGYDGLLAAAQKGIPAWEQITFRMSGGSPRGGGAPALTNAAPARGEGRAESRGGGGGAPAVTVSVKEMDGWPLFASTQITLDPFTGAVLRREGYQDYNLGRQVRSWTRFLHTGEALGLAGQTVAGIASLGALFLVWTGFALTWRRFFGRKGAAEPLTQDASGTRTSGNQLA